MYGHVEDRPTDPGIQPTVRMLLDEHKALLTSILATRIQSQVLIVIILSCVLVTSGSTWKQEALSMSGMLVACSWMLRDITASRRIYEIQEVIAETDANTQWTHAFTRIRYSRWAEWPSRIQLLEPFPWLLLVFFVYLHVIKIGG